jgi:hypothetical protein
LTRDHFGYYSFTITQAYRRSLYRARLCDKKIEMEQLDSNLRKLTEMLSLIVNSISLVEEAIQCLLFALLLIFCFDGIKPQKPSAVLVIISIYFVPAA